MVALRDGKLDKKEHRKFHVHYNKKSNDVAMLKEVLARRLRHKEWPPTSDDIGRRRKRTAWRRQKNLLNI